jgi:hypothetical protein
MRRFGARVHNVGALARAVAVSRVVVSGVLFAMILARCGGGGRTGTFNTSVSGDRPVNGLSSSEITTLCADLANYASDSGLKQDNCLLAGFLMASSQASVLPTATDAELQAACSQTSTICLTTTPNCPVPTPADCTATVGELTACANDVAAQTHLLASKVPACSGITRADIGANSSVGTALAHQPTSCQSYQAKCSGSSSGDGGSGTHDGGVGN